jgi:hypothetical protein
VIAGTSSIFEGGDYWIIRLDTIGNLIWQKTLGGSDEDWCYAVQETFDGGFIVAGEGGSIDGDESGNHGIFDMWVVKLQNPTGTDAPITLAFSFCLYPNPATNLITLQLQSQATVNFPASITIINLLGETVFQKTSYCINGNLQEAISLDKKFAEGTYFVRVTSEQQQWSAPFVITR